MTDTPAHLLYTPQHEWVARDGDTVRVGITAYAQDALGDVVFVTLPDPGAAVTAGVPCAEVESTKSVSEIYAPVDGSVVERNEALDATPDLVNRDPYGEGWIFVVRMGKNGKDGENGERSLSALMDATAYNELVAGA